MKAKRSKPPILKTQVNSVMKKKFAARCGEKSEAEVLRKLVSLFIQGDIDPYKSA